MAGKRHVILGSGTAGLNAIRTLRQLGDDGPIVLVSAEAPYSRMVLPYYLARRITEPHVTTATGRQLDEWGVERQIGRRAEGLDTKAAKLRLDNGEDVAYDDLLIATGSSALRPPIPGAEHARCFNFWTLDDAKGVNKTISPDAHVVMVGAGFISFTILNAILERAGRLTIVEVAPRILPRMIDDAGAALVTDWLTERGVTIRAGAEITGIAERGQGLRLTFAEGDSIDADLVLMATGIRPNLGWLDGSGIETNQGILVDEYLRSNVDNVYAAGDVAEGRNRVTGAREVHAIEPTAMEHGRIAAANMAGKKIAYPGSLLMNIVSAAGLDMASFGSWDDDGAEVVAAQAPARRAYRKYLFRGGRMVGAILIESAGETWSGNDVGMLKGLVQSGVDLSAWKSHLAERPFEIKKPYLATGTTARLLPETIIGQPSPAM
ncbi:MAG: FAD-dependent oxidoreductase [SAR324 cluster bacterium]|nr:FAD-dependent oxidoreductase [SAR324 cluster bacterium]